MRFGNKLFPFRVVSAFQKGDKAVITELLKVHQFPVTAMVSEPNEKAHDKTYKMACEPSEDSDQPGHPPSLIRVFACAQWVAKDPSFLHADSEGSDQTGRMPRLICLRLAHMPFCRFNDVLAQILI